MAVADAFMLVRGDLGVETPLELVPDIRKTLTRVGRRFGKPVVVATQMLEFDDHLAGADARGSLRRRDSGVSRARTR